MTEKTRTTNSGSHVLGDVPADLPALQQALEISRRVVAIGFEWKTVDDIWAKVAEERAEFEEAYALEPDKGGDLSGTDAELEFGDLLFSIVNVGRKLGINAENALLATNEKFRRRFARMEDAAREQERRVEGLSLDEMEELWQEAKKGE